MKGKTINSIPADSNAEQLILSSILCDNDVIFHILDLISPSDFYVLMNKSIYSCMFTLCESCESIEPITTHNKWGKYSFSEYSECNEINEYLSLLKQLTPSLSEVEQYCKIVKHKSDLRKLLNIAKFITESVSSEKNEAETLINDIVVLLEELDESIKYHPRQRTLLSS